MVHKTVKMVHNLLRSVMIDVSLRQFRISLIVAGLYSAALEINLRLKK